MLLFPRPEPHRAIDPRAGIPAGIGLVAVAGDDQKLVLSLQQQACQVHIEVGVAVGAGGDLLPVEPDLRVMIHALEFQQQRLVPQLRRQGEDLAVFVVAALEPADVALPQAGGDSCFRAHGVMRDLHRDRIPAQWAACPAAVEIQSLHGQHPLCVFLSIYFLP